MFTRPHLNEGRRPRRWSPAISYNIGWVILPFFLFGLLVGYWRMRLDVQEWGVPDWRPVLTQADLSRKNGDLYQAKVFYSQAAWIASWREDWEGLIAVACGTKRLGPMEGLFGTTYSLLARAMLAAESKQSRAGMDAVAKAFTAIGEHNAASVVLSRIQKGWVEQAEESSSDAVLRRCWEPDEGALRREDFVGG